MLPAQEAFPGRPWRSALRAPWACEVTVVNFRASPGTPRPAAWPGSRRGAGRRARRGDPGTRGQRRPARHRPQPGWRPTWRPSSPGCRQARVPVLLAGMKTLAGHGPGLRPGIRGGVRPPGGQIHGLVFYPFFLEGVAGVAGPEPARRPASQRPRACGRSSKRFTPTAEAFLKTLDCQMSRPVLAPAGPRFRSGPSFRGRVHPERPRGRRVISGQSLGDQDVLASSGWVGPGRGPASGRRPFWRTSTGMRWCTGRHQGVGPAGEDGQALARTSPVRPGLARTPRMRGQGQGRARSPGR